MLDDDLRDRQKVATLPDDLKQAADELLQKKFKLPVRGEVVQEDPKDSAVKYVSSDTMMAQMIRQRRPVTCLITLSKDSCSPGSWLQYYEDRPNKTRGWMEHMIPVDLVGAYTGNRYSEGFPMDRFYDSTYDYRLLYLERMIDYKSREMLEPLILIDPRHYH